MNGELPGRMYLRVALALCIVGGMMCYFGSTTSYAGQMDEKTIILLREQGQRVCDLLQSFVIKFEYWAFDYKKDHIKFFSMETDFQNWQKGKNEIRHIEISVFPTEAGLKNQLEYRKRVWGDFSVDVGSCGEAFVWESDVPGQVNGELYCENLFVFIKWYRYMHEDRPWNEERDRWYREGVAEFLPALKALVSTVARAKQACECKSESRTPIIFLPGVAGTQLYDVRPTGLEQHTQLWPFKLSAERDRANLALDKDGETKIFPDANIVVGDIIREAQQRCLPNPITYLEKCHADFYGGMIDYLIHPEQGYKEGTDLFVFPYDWRLSNKKHYDQLDQTIKTALNKSGAKKVILLAHSMGGIIARAYVYSTPERAARVDSFITMGTPYWGTPKAYHALVNGYTFGNPTVRQELMKILSQNMPSVYELLPRAPFIKDTAMGKDLTLDESYGIRYKWFTGHRYDIIDYYGVTSDNVQTFNPALLEKSKQFHSTVGSKEKPAPLPAGVRQYVIIGVGISTLSGWVLHDWKPGNWPAWLVSDTYLELANGRKVVLRPTVGDGDSSVPLWSLETAAATRTYYVPYKRGWILDESSAHGDLAQNKTVQSIVGQIVKNTPPDPSKHPRPQYWFDRPLTPWVTLEDFAEFELHSDAHLRVVHASGKALGFNDEGGIDESLPGTFLSMDGVEYASLADLNQNYKVSVNGINAGKFRLSVRVTKEGKITAFSYPEVPVKEGTVAQFNVTPSQVTTDLPPLQVTTDGQTTSVTAKQLDTLLRQPAIKPGEKIKVEKEEEKIATGTQLVNTDKFNFGAKLSFQDGKWLIAELSPNKESVAPGMGLEVGDIIVLIDDKDAETLNSGQMQEIFNKPPGTWIMVTIQQKRTGDLITVPLQRER